MSTSRLQLVLLPGLDGTGKLFKGFVTALASNFESEIIAYPTDQHLDYSQLASNVRSTLSSCGPYVLVAESFSTPLAIQLAAESSQNLKGLILCAGFASSPVPGVLRSASSVLAPAFFRISLPETAVRFLLLGVDAPSDLVAAVKNAVSSVQPRVLAARIRTVVACDVRSELGKISKPILYIRAMRDRLVPVSCLHEIQGVSSRVVAEFIDAPHLVLQRKPEQAAGVVKKFVLRLKD
jgi:pimeloyl-[acyl-carrier protein] methyl ester esterase